MSTNAKVDFEIEVPEDLARLQLPEGLDRRLQALLSRLQRRRVQLLRCRILQLIDQCSLTDGR